jgi:hypothetical protein
MIVKDYYQNINVHKPKDYFERWYADVWRRRIGTPNAPPGILERILDEELELVGARYVNTERGYRFKVFFEQDQDYTAFVLRWA